MEITLTIDNNEDEIIDLLRSLHRKVDKMATDITQLETVIEELSTETGIAVGELEELATQIGALEVGQITQDQVDALKDKAASAVETLKTEVNKVAEEHPAPEEAAPTEAKPEKTVYTVNPEASLEGIDTTQYSTSGFVTVPAEGGTAETLYYFSGDTAEGDANGANAAYAVYTGATVQQTV
jgi:outer membrane murein-binding lipoprotein Lpp